MFKEAGIDPAKIHMEEVEEEIPEIDLDAKLASRVVKRHDLKRWIIYPEDAYKSGWDIVMTR
jgi:hypothetical protein